MKIYNDIYLSVRSILRQRGVENYNLEAKLIVAKAAKKTGKHVQMAISYAANSGRHPAIPRIFVGLTIILYRLGKK